MPRLLKSPDLTKHLVRRTHATDLGRRQHAFLDLARVGIRIEREDALNGRLESILLGLAERDKRVERVAHFSAETIGPLVHIGDGFLDGVHHLVRGRRGFRKIDEPPVAVLGDEVAAAIAAADRVDFRRCRRGRFQQELAFLDFIKLPRIGERFVRPQAAQYVDEFERPPIALLALQHCSAEHAEFFIEPAVDDVERHAPLANAIERNRKLRHHHRIPQSGMHGDQRADPIEPRPDCARQHPGGEVVAKVALGEQHKVEADAISGDEQIDTKIELGIEPPVRQRR